MEAVCGIFERSRVGGGARGGTPSNHLGWQIKQQKINNIKYIVAFWRLLVDHFTRNNQPKTDTHNGEEYGEDVQPGIRREQNAIATFGDIRILLEVKTKIKWLS
jgi:hypothetical protein